MIELHLTLPPSANKLWKPVAKGRMIRTPAYTRWLDTAGWECNAQRQRPIPEPYVLTIKVPEAFKGDIDNVVKATSDLMHHQCLVLDDKHMRELHVSRHDGTLMIVTIEAFEASNKTSAGTGSSPADALTTPEPTENKNG